MRVSAFAVALVASLVPCALAKRTTNAERFKRGLSPLAPARPYTPTRVHLPRASPSAYSCAQSGNTGVIRVIQKGQGSDSDDVLGYVAFTNIVEASSPPVLSDGGIFAFDEADTPNVGITYVSHSSRNWVIRSDDADLSTRGRPMKYGDILYKDINNLLNYAYPGETFDSSPAGSGPRNMSTNIVSPGHSEPAEQHVFYIDSENNNKISVTWVQPSNANNANPQTLEPFVCNSRLRWSTDPTKSHQDSCKNSGFFNNVELRFVCCAVDSDGSC